MDNVIYDCPHTCLACGGENKLINPSYESYVLHESNTECTVCGHKNYWAHGWYQYKKDD